MQGELAQDFRYNKERGLTGYDVRNRFVASFLYDLPFAKTRRVLGGWQLSGIFQAQSGFPFTVLLASATANNGRSTRPDVVAGQQPNLGRDGRTLTRYFNPSVFTPPASFQTGNSGVMNVIGPGLHTLDVGILKTIRLVESHSLQARVEFFNFYNHPSWGAPNNSLGSSAYNTISSQSVPPRQLQFGLKYLF